MSQIAEITSLCKFACVCMRMNVWYESVCRLRGTGSSLSFIESSNLEVWFLRLLWPGTHTHTQMRTVGDKKP